MYDTITNYINAKGLTSRRAPELIRGFEECYIDLKKNEKEGFHRTPCKIGQRNFKENGPTLRRPQFGLPISFTR